MIVRDGFRDGVPGVNNPSVIRAFTASIDATSGISGSRFDLYGLAVYGPLFRQTISVVAQLLRCRRSYGRHGVRARRQIAVRLCATKVDHRSNAFSCSRMRRDEIFKGVGCRLTVGCASLDEPFRLCWIRKLQSRQRSGGDLRIDTCQ